MDWLEDPELTPEQRLSRFQALSPKPALASPRTRVNLSAGTATFLTYDRGVTQ